MIMALYVTFWRPKLRVQFSENLELWIYEFLFNSGDRLFKKKKIYGSSENWKFKIWQTFSTNSLFFGLILFFLFVLSKRVRQKSGSSHSNVFIKERVHREKYESRENPWKATLKELIFGKVVGFRSANFWKVNSFTDNLQRFC